MPRFMPAIHAKPTWQECAHPFGFDTAAYVPGGVCCSHCDTLILQFIPQPPEVLGYLSADWAWHHRDGKPWTTSNKLDPKPMSAKTEKRNCHNCHWLKSDACADRQIRKHEPAKGCGAWTPIPTASAASDFDPGDFLAEGPPRPAQPAKLKIANSQLPILNPEVLSPDQAAAVDRAKAYYTGIRTSGQQMGLYGFLFGNQLLALKDTEHGEHGRWMKFCAANFPEIKDRTINYFMAAAVKFAADANLPTVGIKLLPDGSLPKPLEKQITEAWYEHADGKSVRDLLRESGAIREKKPQVFTPPRPLTAEEKLAAETEQLRAPHLGVAEHAQIILDRSELDNAKLGPKDWNDTLAVAVRLGKLARHFRRTLKARSAKAAKAAKAAKVTSKAKAQWEKLKNKNPIERQRP